MAPATINYLKKLSNQPKYQDYKLVVAGHSLGGALATLSLIRYQEALQLPWNRTHLFTYGSPRVGNQHFVNWVNSQPMESTRVVNEGDLVPVLPERYYTHIHTELYIKNGQSVICGTTSYEDPQCSTGAVSPMKDDAHLSAWGMKLDDRYCH